ncbi:uncharacterized protein LOC134215317 [Armigeres subalbatus]|uniref:uncharacterized protein LOC134215317 n=1 Tax=Armigeres subalbatus TaxID=124917 RepID=UPI002ED00F5D
MMKLFCLFVFLAMAVAHPTPGNQNDRPEAPANQEMLPEVSDDGDMENAETFGFGFHNHYHIVPQYYGGSYYGGFGGYGGYGGYYPYYARNYGYPYYY